MSSPYPFSLPSNPNVEQLRNQAKDLLRAFKERHSDIPSRLRRSNPEMANLSDAEVFRARFALKGARRVIAREYGFTEWTDLKREVEAAHVQDDLDTSAAHEHEHAARASLALGDLAGARRSADALWKLAQHTPDAMSGDGQSILWKANLLRGIIAYAEGEWRIAKVHFRYCDENLASHRGEWELHAAWAILENEVGHRAEARRRLKTVTGVGDDRDAERLSMAAFISASIGRTTENARMLETAERLGRDVLSIGASNHVEARARIALAFAAVERGDTLSAREQYDALLPYRGVLTNGHLPSPTGCWRCSPRPWDVSTTRRPISRMRWPSVATGSTASRVTSRMSTPSCYSLARPRRPGTGNRVDVRRLRQVPLGIPRPHGAAAQARDGLAEG